MSVRKKLIIFIAALLVLDQAVKIWIKTHMMIGEEFTVFNWFKILFIENNGMAFGMELGDGKIGKTILSLFRIVAVIGIGWYILKLIREKAPTGVLFSFALIFCGAIGNIFDSLFYGMIFNDQPLSSRYLISERRRLFLFFTWQSRRYVVFPSYRRNLPGLVSHLGGRKFSVFPSRFQFCGFLYHHRSLDTYPFLPEIFLR